MVQLSMVQFNQIFLQKMKEVKILEKTHPKKAIPLWINVCELIVTFAKSPNCPRDLRPKLIRQAEIIIAKVKLFQQGNLESVFNADLAQTQKPSSVSTSILFAPTSPPPSEPDAEEDMLATLQALPDIPVESDPATSDPNPPSSPGDPPFTPAEHPKPSDSTPSLPTSPSELSSLKDLEEQLKQMPSNFTEITPAPFTNASIISGIQSADPNLNLDEFKKDTTTLDITSSTVVSDTEPAINPNAAADSQSLKFSNIGVASDPFKAASNSSNSPDPFGPESLQDVDVPDADKQSCFACGAGLPAGVLICPTCNTDNSEKPTE
jgi:hypothetical protein